MALPCGPRPGERTEVGYRPDVGFGLHIVPEGGYYGVVRGAGGGYGIVVGIVGGDGRIKGGYDVATHVEIHTGRIGETVKSHIKGDRNGSDTLVYSREQLRGG